MNDSEAMERFKNLTFDEFRRLAEDEDLTPRERIGFPNSYREGKEDCILTDIVGKLQNLSETGKVVLDIGPGCSDLAMKLIELCGRRKHRLVLIDSEEMLAHLPDEPFVSKVSGRYPRACENLLSEYRGTVDVILTYSVCHYVFSEGNIFDFIDVSLQLLSDGGEMLIGDIPNISKRKRFFSSANGIRFHRTFTGTDTTPAVRFNEVQPGKPDDAVLMGILMRCRNAGFDAYLVPQAKDLPMANRREDILIRKP